MPKHQLKKEKIDTVDGIDGSKYDIRMIITGASDSEDFGYVEGVPIDPPDDSPGWKLVKFWVEHDTVQEKVPRVAKDGEGKVKDSDLALLTRKTNPAYHQLWARPKTKVVVAKAKPTTAAGAKPPSESTEAPKRGRGRPRNAPATPPEQPPAEEGSESATAGE